VIEHGINKLTLYFVTNFITTHIIKELFGEAVCASSGLRHFLTSYSYNIYQRYPQMSLQVLPPHFEADKKRYTFTFKNAPRMEATTDDPTKLAITEEELSDIFISEFLKQASKYFSKPLESSLFYKRLVYEYFTDEVDISSIRETGDTFRATWIPARIVFYTSRYELQLSLAELEPVIVPSAIPPGFLNELGVIGEELDAEGEETDLPELPIAEVQEEIIPFGEISEEEKARREVARKRIRQARLRASLAQLRAERMADRYYKRYGNFDMDSEESELSSDEESGKI
jgi:hypothetical protein